MSDYKALSDALTIAVDTGNRDLADGVLAEVLYASPRLTEEERAELARDHQSAVDAGEI